MINKINIKNFKMIDDICIDSKGYRFILIHGDPYNGKSAVLSAVGLARHNQLESKIVEYVNWKVRNTKGGKFEIEIDEDFKEHNYYQILKSNKTGLDRFLTIDKDETNVFKNTNAFSELEREFSVDLVKNAVYSPQREITKILFTQPSERLKEFKNIFGLNKISNVSSFMQDEERLIKKEIEISEIEIKVLQDKKFELNEVPKITIDIDKIDLKIKELSEEKEKFEKDLKLYNKYISDKEKFDNAKLLIEKYTVDCLNKDKFLDSLIENEDMAVDYSDYENIKSKLNEIEKEKIQLENDIKQYLKASSDISIKQKSIENVENEVKSIIIKRVSKPDFDNNDIKKISNSIIEKKSELISLEKKYKAILKGECETCGADYSGYSEDDKKSIIENIDSIKKEVKELELDIDTKKNVLENYLNIISSNNVNTEKRNGLLSKINDLTSEIEKCKLVKEPEKNIAEIDDSIEKYKIAIVTYESNIKKQEKIKIYNNSIKEQKIKATAEKVNFQKQIIELSKVNEPEKVETPNFDNGKFDYYKEQAIEYKSQCREKENIEKINESIEKERSLNYKEIDIKQKLLFEKQKRVNILNGTRASIDKEYSAYRINKGSDYTKNEMNRFFQSIHNRCEVSYENTDKGINFYYQDMDHQIPTEFNLSSGLEADLISTSFRIALCKMTNAGVILLDEIDKYANTKLALNLWESIIEEEHLKQIFCITHNDSIKEMLINRNDCIDYEIKNGVIVNR